MASIRELTPGRWNAQIRRKGVRSISATFDNEADARAWAAQHEARILDNRAEATRTQSNNEITLSTLVKEYFNSLLFEEKRERTRRREKQASVAPLSMIGQYSLSQLSHATLQTQFFDKRAKDTYRGKRISGDTIRLERAFLSSCFNYAAARDYIKFNPLLKAKYQLPKIKGRDFVFSVEQENAILRLAITWVYDSDKVNYSIYPWLCFCFSTGTRPGEAARIEIANLDLEKRLAYIPKNSHKNNQARTISIPDNIVPDLEQQVSRAKSKKSKYLFHSLDGERPFAYGQQFIDLCRALDIEGAVPHSIRHTYITRLFERTDLNETQIAALVGQVNVLSLRSYAHIRSQYTQEHSDTFNQELMRLRREADEKTRVIVSVAK